MGINKHIVSACDLSALLASPNRFLPLIRREPKSHGMRTKRLSEIHYNRLKQTNEMRVDQAIKPLLRK